MKRLASILICILLTFSPTILLMNVSDYTEGLTIEYNGMDYVSHSPIRINTNSNFDAAHGVVNWATGNGSPGNPWIIENWDINGIGIGTCIFIGNTTDYFVIKDCHLHEANGAYGEPFFRNSGIHLFYASNGKIENNTAHSNNYCGLLIFYSNNNNIINNSFYNNNWGIYSQASNNNKFIGNNIYQNNKGLWLGWAGVFIGSQFNYIYNNNVSTNGNGIIIHTSNYNTVMNNIASWNTDYGIYLDTASYNIIKNNNASYNNGSFDNSGIILSFSNNNNVTNNTLFNNYIGIYMQYSTNNSLINNKLTKGGIYFIGTLLEYYNSHSIDLSNTVNNKPIYYLKNQTNGSVPSEAGQVILSNCSNMIIENFNNQNIFCGIQVGFSENVTIINNTASNTVDGIQLAYSKYCTVQNNLMSSNERWGLHIYRSNQNDIANNSFVNNWRGLYSAGAFNNSIHNNNVINNTEYDFYFTTSGLVWANNYIFHNNFIDTPNADDRSGNFWNLPYPGGGNYWSDYNGVDEKSGPGQDQPGSDGFGDTNYSIEGEGGSVDDHPLMRPFEFEFTDYTILLNQGWNLISTPLIQSNGSPDKVLENITGKWNVVKYYDTLDTADPWKSYRSNGTVNDLTDIDNTIGFWIYVTESNLTLTLNGFIPTSTTISLYAGWNLVGYPTQTTQTVGNALWGTGADRVEVFDPISPYIKEVGPTYIMKPGEGYWVHVPTDTIWIVNW